MIIRYVEANFFGYVDNIEDLQSWKWLKERNYIDGDEYWNYECNPRIVLDAHRFKEFIDLYRKDYKKEYGKDLFYTDIEEIEKIIKDKDSVLLEWY